MTRAVAAALAIACGVPHDLPGSQPARPLGASQTVTITGPALTDDTFVSSEIGNGPSENWGAWPVFSKIRTGKPLVRLHAGSIPDGTITGLRFVFRASSAGNVSQVYRVVADWGEGDGLGMGEVDGGASWGFAAYPSLPWGEPGCSSPKADFDPDDLPPQVTTAAAGTDTVLELPPSWAEEWRDGMHPDNGFMMVQRSGVPWSFDSSESDFVDRWPRFEVDFIEE